jgi:hypothetical protein
MFKRRFLAIVTIIFLITAFVSTTVIANTYGYATYRNCAITTNYQGSELCDKASAQAKSASSYICRFNVGFVAGSNMYGTSVVLSNVYQTRSYGWISSSLNYDAFCHSYIASQPNQYFEYINFNVA